MAKILITGIAGFVGSNLAEYFLKKKHEIVGIDNLSTGNKENLKVLGKRIKLIKGDIRKYKDVKKATKDVDYVLHYAALPSVPYSVEHPVETHDVNVTGTFNVLMAARDSNVEKVVFASSSAIYGNTKKLPIDESAPLDPVSPYAAHKIIGEKYCKLFQNVYGLRTTSLRYFNIYGPRQNPNAQYAAVVPKFISLMKAGTQPMIFGDGKQTRDFVSVFDVAKANILVLNNKKSDGQSYNIASGRKTSVLDLVNSMNKLMKTNIKPILGEVRAGDIKHSYCSISKAKKELKFKPEYNLDKGLKYLI